MSVTSPGHAIFNTRSPAAAREEVLEELWTAQESGTALTIGTLARTIHAGADEGWGGVVQELVEGGLVDLDGGSLTLTGRGHDAAREVVRRHRLAEVLFHEVLELPMAETESEACRVEHVLTSQATDAVCSFLGHPPVCPHGHPIPSGACCSTLSRRVATLICRLSDLNPGERGRVVLLAPKHRDRLEQLTDLGVTPGAVLTLRQRKPSLVVEVDRTLLALEAEIAEGIYLRPLVEW
ncbi:MAG: metal-dependent transcriptional regulator [Acidobacteriota bacterium]